MQMLYILLCRNTNSKTRTIIYSVNTCSSIRCRQSAESVQALWNRITPSSSLLVALHVSALPCTLLFASSASPVLSAEARSWEEKQLGLRSCHEAVDLTQLDCTGIEELLALVELLI